MKRFTKKQGIIALCVMVPVATAITFIVKRGRK